jgi:pyrroline-5-carboxylate reductase
MNRQILFVGGGNMATSLVGGLVARGTSPQSIVVADPDPAQRLRLERDYGVATVPDAAAALDGVPTVVLAVKPQQMAPVAQALAPAASASRPLVISVAAGIRLSDLARWLGPGIPLVRSMPNRPRVTPGAPCRHCDAGPHRFEGRG